MVSDFLRNGQVIRGWKENLAGGGGGVGQCVRGGGEISWSFTITTVDGETSKDPKNIVIPESDGI